MIALKFSSTAIIFAWMGSRLLSFVALDILVYQYELFDHVFTISIIKIMMAMLMLIFLFIEVHPKLSKLTFSNDKIFMGGAVSGFFGGLAGFQGALRSMFLLKFNLTKEGFIATGIFIACMIDITRLSIYLTYFKGITINDHKTLLLASVISAFAGAYLGSKLIKKVTIKTVQIIVSFLLAILALLLLFGIL
ncbi:MAG: TSUP family transporter [Saprospiraceae bacterium]|nr:TSUP family transporter [Saprospiraceae bacterium]